MDESGNRQFPAGADTRAKTLVVRCWHERGDGDALHLRGSVRDLSRGRAVSFEGFQALTVILRTILGDQSGLPPSGD